jgi:hypothetical protein
VGEVVTLQPVGLPERDFAPAVDQWTKTIKSLPTAEGYAKLSDEERREANERLGAHLLEIKALRGEIEDTFRPTITAAHKTWQEALKARARHDDPLEKTEALGKGLQKAYLNHEDAVQREAERQASLAAKKAEEDILLEQAQAFEDAGDPATAAAIVAAAPVAPPPPPPVPRTVPQVTGVTSALVWKGRVTDLMALVKAIAAGAPGVSLALLQPAGQATLDAWAKSTKGAVQSPGIVAYQERQVSLRSAR